MYVFYIYIMYNLVGGFNHLETYELVNGKGDIPYMKWKIKAMFQTTNQYIYICWGFRQNRYFISIHVSIS